MWKYALSAFSYHFMYSLAVNKCSGFIPAFYSRFCFRCDNSNKLIHGKQMYKHLTQSKNLPHFLMV